jgi:hypothetical protein
VPIHCCVCLNSGVTREADVDPARRYQACAEHREIVDADDFDPMTLRPKQMGAF